MSGIETVRYISKFRDSRYYMKDLLLEHVIVEDGRYWKLATIKAINGGGRCAVSKTENIDESDLYYYEGEIRCAHVQEPPEGSIKVITVYHWFKDITTKVNARIVIECEPCKDTKYFKVSEPVNIKLKETPRQRKKRLKKLAS